MHLLYLDDAGSPGNPNEKHFVLAGIALFERQTHWLQTELDGLAAGLGQGDPADIEFHGSPIATGRGRSWRGVPKEQRATIIRCGLEAARALKGEWRLFGVVVDKQARSPEDPVAYAFEQLCSRFDLFLKRLYAKGGEPQRGLIILDKSAPRDPPAVHGVGIQDARPSLGRDAESGRSPAVRRFESNPPHPVRRPRCICAVEEVREAGQRVLHVIAGFFDREGSTVHGLHHYKNLNDPCDCPACLRSF